MSHPTTRNPFSRDFLWMFGILMLLGAVQQSPGADFLIVERVEGLAVYNKYQQEASIAERGVFLPFVPMKIIKLNDVLGDGFTPCMRVEIESQIFYLLKDKSGRLLRSGAAGSEKTFSNATTLFDTVQILTGRSILFLPTNSHERHLASKELLVRVFRHQNMTYCRTLSVPPVFGWVNFMGKKEGGEWIISKHHASSATTISSVVAQGVQLRVEEVNRMLTRLFQFFNSQTNQQKSAPAWTIESSNTAITCTLGGAGNNEQFEQSTFYLVNEIENIALGSEFQVTHSPGRIEIRPK